MCLLLQDCNDMLKCINGLKIVDVSKFGLRFLLTGHVVTDWKRLEFLEGQIGQLVDTLAVSLQDIGVMHLHLDTNCVVDRLKSLQLNHRCLLAIMCLEFLEGQVGELVDTLGVSLRGINVVRRRLGAGCVTD